MSNQLMNDLIRREVRARQGVVDLDEGETEVEAESEQSPDMNKRIRHAVFGRYPAASSGDASAGDDK
jgi:hypothetical protein